MKCGLLLLLCLLPSTILARLGETETQLVARFGPAVSRTKEITIAQGKFIEFGVKLTFQQNDWRISCAIVEGRSARETYSHSGDWTENQFATVLTANAQGTRWTDISKDQMGKFVREWRRTDGGMARWKRGDGMEVTHPTYLRAKDLAEKKAKAAAAHIPKI